MFAPIIAPVLTIGSSVAAAPVVTVTPGNGKNSIAWVDGASASPITGHKLYASTTSGTMVFIGTITGASPYTDTSLTNGVARFYRVSAINSAGEGALSSEAGATPRAAAAPPFFGSTTSTWGNTAPTFGATA